MINCHFRDEPTSDLTGALASCCAALDAVDGGPSVVCVTSAAVAADSRGWRSADPDEMVARFRRGAVAVRTLALRFPALELRLGVELEYRPEWLGLYERLLSTVPFDFVLGSVHRVDGHDISGGLQVDPFFLGRSRDEAVEAYFGELAALVAWGGFDAVTHFDLIKRFGHRHYGRFMPGTFRPLIEPILAEMGRKEIGLEINTSGIEEAPGAPYPEPEILEWARALGVEFLTLGADVRASGEIVPSLTAGVRLARETGWKKFTVYEARQQVGQIRVAA